MSCQVIDVNYRRSPLIQGGLEIPIQVTVDMDAGAKKIKSVEEV